VKFFRFSPIPLLTPPSQNFLSKRKKSFFIFGSQDNTQKTGPPYFPIPPRQSAQEIAPRFFLRQRLLLHLPPHNPREKGKGREQQRERDDTAFVFFPPTYFAPSAPRPCGTERTPKRHRAPRLFFLSSGYLLKAPTAPTRLKEKFFVPAHQSGNLIGQFSTKPPKL